jgi:hypothetical protein
MFNSGILRIAGMPFPKAILTGKVDWEHFSCKGLRTFAQLADPDVPWKWKGRLREMRVEGLLIIPR